MEISVIIPCYEYGKYLADAIHSLIGGKTSLGEFAPQTFQNFDIWIVNDASTDNTNEVAKSFISDRIHYIRNEINFGTAAALNAGIRLAGGKYITFLSADDMMETTRLEKLHTAILANPHRVIYDDLTAFKDGYRTDKLPMPAYDFDRLLYKNTMAAGILYPRSAWDAVGGYPEQFKDGREDWAFSVLLGSHGYCGIHVKEALYLYRREGQNRSLHNGGAEGRIKWLQKMRDAFPALYRGERMMACCGAKKVRSDKSVASRTTPARNVSSPRAVVDLRVGVEGMVLLEYQLNKAGHVMYTGSVTGQQYAFGGSHKRGHVDARDAPALLDRYESRRHVFAVVDVTPPPAQAPVIETQVITIQKADSINDAEASEAGKILAQHAQETKSTRKRKVAA